MVFCRVLHDFFGQNKFGMQSENLSAIYILDIHQLPCGETTFVSLHYLAEYGALAGGGSGGKDYKSAL